MTNINTTATETNAAATDTVKLTRAEKQAKQIAVLEKRIADDTAKLAELKQEVETGARLEGVTTGSAITARVGRGETSKVVAARVLGVKDDDNGSRRYKIAYGEGFDADTVVIQPAQIVEVLVEPTAEATDGPSATELTEVGRDEFDRPVNVYGQVIGG